MRIGIDVDLLLAAHNRDDPDHEAVNGRLRGHAAAPGNRLLLPYQVLAEFYRIITDRTRVATPVTPVRAGHVCRRYMTSPDVEVTDSGGAVLDQALYHAAKRGIRGLRMLDLEVAFALVAARADELHTRRPEAYEGISGLKVVGLAG